MSSKRESRGEEGGKSRVAHKLLQVYTAPRLFKNKGPLQSKRNFPIAQERQWDRPRERLRERPWERPRAKPRERPRERPQEGPRESQQEKLEESIDKRMLSTRLLKENPYARIRKASPSEYCQLDF